MSDTGKLIRMGRILPSDRRGVCFAADHGMQLGPVDGLADLEAALSDAVDARFDAVILSAGALRRYGNLFAGRDRPSTIVRVDQTTMWRIGSENGYDEGHTRLVGSVARAAALGADGVLSYFFVGHRDPALEQQMFEIAGRVSEQAQAHGLVYVAEPMAAREGLYSAPFSGAVVATNARMAVEMGADIVKCDWAGSSGECEQVVAAAMGAPVMVAGGARGTDDEATVDLVADLLAGGANGVMFGRSLFQSTNRRALMGAIRAMVHEGMTAKEAKAELGSGNR